MTPWMNAFKLPAKNRFPAGSRPGNVFDNLLKLHTCPRMQTRRQRVGIYIILRSNIYTPKSGRAPDPVALLTALPFCDGPALAPPASACAPCQPCPHGWPQPAPARQDTPHPTPLAAWRHDRLNIALSCAWRGVPYPAATQGALIQRATPQRATPQRALLPRRRPCSLTRPGRWRTLQEDCACLPS